LLHLVGDLFELYDDAWSYTRPPPPPTKTKTMIRFVKKKILFDAILSGDVTQKR
jgi:hypothetical protein